LWLDAGAQTADRGPDLAIQVRTGCASICLRNAMSRTQLHIFYSGWVQGVGFRYTVKALASGFEVTGIVRNLSDGRVELLAEGTKEELEAFRRAIQDSEVGRFIRNEQDAWNEAREEFRGFVIGR
jgi:acylphosphatase